MPDYAVTIVLIAMAVVGTGCASLEQHLGDPLPLERYEQLPTGSHYGTVLALFGPPHRMTALPAGMAFQYEYVRIDERQYGLVLPGDIGKWIKAVYGTAEATVQAVVLLFDSDGSLRGADSEIFLADGGGGFSMTLIFSMGSLTDTRTYEESADSATVWGRGMIDPLTQVLNRDSNLETGANGLQLPGTPVRAGQHSLELRAP
jgi:hypothetical protein